MTPHPSRICDSYLDNKLRCQDCMTVEEEIDFWQECYHGNHKNLEDCPTYYDGCNCGGAIVEERDILLEKLNKMSKKIE